MCIRRRFASSTSPRRKLLFRSPRSRDIRTSRLRAARDFHSRAMGSLVSTTSSSATPAAPARSRHNALALQLHPRHARNHHVPDPRASNASERANARASFDALPDELVEVIIGLLPGDNLAVASCVERRIRRLAANDDLWLGALRRDFGAAFAPPPGARVPRGRMKLIYADCRATFRAIVRGRANESKGRFPTPDISVGVRVYV